MINQCNAATAAFIIYFGPMHWGVRILLPFFITFSSEFWKDCSTESKAQCRIFIDRATSLLQQQFPFFILFILFALFIDLFFDLFFFILRGGAGYSLAELFLRSCSSLSLFFLFIFHFSSSLFFYLSSFFYQFFSLFLFSSFLYSQRQRRIFIGPATSTLQ